MSEDDVRTFAAERLGDFSTDKIVYKCTERYERAFINPRMLNPTRVIHNIHERLALAMARVTTPYAPCTDLPKQE